MPLLLTRLLPSFEEGLVLRNEQTSRVRRKL